jgi:hypothetical protein
MPDVTCIARFFVWLLVGLGTAAALQSTQAAPARPILTATNEAYLNAVMADPADLDINDIHQVFGRVFQALPDRVTVYPTEGYYYVRFYHAGLPYAGNFRLDITNRDQGIINFAYFEARSHWREDDSIRYRAFGAADGVRVRNTAKFEYVVTVEGKTVVFALNDLSEVRPPDGVLNEDELYLGPVFDESGIQFFLVYNPRLKLFHYVLDEREPVPDELYNHRNTDRIVIGRRTGFAFYRDHYANRKILIGVHQDNATLNTYFDGPFDQLPDDYIEGDALRDAIVDAGLAKKAEIDRFGILPGGDERVLIKPYMSYAYIDDLEVFSDCATDRDLPRELYHECFVLYDPGIGLPAQGLDNQSAAQVAHKTVPETESPAELAQQVPVLNADGDGKTVELPSGQVPRLAFETNQQLIEQWRGSSGLDTNAPDEVFARILAELPSKVKVYPTENYYYFEFIENGISWSGNFRFGVEDRDKGYVHFTYYPTFTMWRRDQVNYYKKFGEADGVTVNRIAPLNYRVEFKQVLVEFELNDLAEIVPPAGRLSADETFIGPVFDESGLQFHLVYNRALKLFHYILDESQPVPDDFSVSDVSPRITIGKRTGFAFYQDKNIDRRILIGVYADNSSVNNWLDGPFDQLPDNFIKDDTLRNALVEMVPELAGRIDRYGAWDDGESRYLIGPYLYYMDTRELASFDDCAVSPQMATRFYYACFQIEEAYDRQTNSQESGMGLQ